VLAALLLTACAPGTPPRDADVIVVGAGIAGISAALEAESQGARVLVMEMSSVPGGHAVRAAGFALVDTPLQQAKGLRDSPDIAYRDIMAWGEDADPGWVRFYADNARTQVHDWLVSLGVKFAFVLDTPEDTVPRFHFTRGAAVNAIVPMIGQALKRGRIEFVWNSEATGVLQENGRIAGVNTRNTRSGAERAYRAPAVIVATGGFQSNLELVRKTWNTSVPAPERLLIGAGAFALGSGLRIAEPVGARLYRMDHHVTYGNGLPDPRDPAGEHGLLTQNPAAVWVDATGRRFTNEAAPAKVTDRAVIRNSPATVWLIFDAEGLKKLTIRGTAWLSTETIRKEILDNPALVKRADSIADLAAAAGLPPDALTDTITRFNRFIEQGMDTDFGRIGPGTTPPAQLKKPPFYAIQLYPMTRKSMGGLAIDRETQVLDGEGKPIPGLFAAGEVTGVAGINGSFGGSGTFLGPSVLTGRVAGRSAVAFLPELPKAADGEAGTAPASAPAAGDAGVSPAPDAAALGALLQQKRDGYWHFGVAHTLVLERKDECASCHKGSWPPGPAVTTEQRLVQLESCTRCH
jgi:flavocytochrome c